MIKKSIPKETRHGYTMAKYCYIGNMAVQMDTKQTSSTHLCS